MSDASAIASADAPTLAPADRPAGLPDPRLHPVFLGGEIYRRSVYGPKHPLSIPRVSTATDLARAMGWLAPGDYVDSPMATPDQLARFHHPDYIAALIRAEAEQRVDPETAARFNLGKLENPVFGEMFRRPATAAGASLLAADLLAEGGVVYSPAGGTHHGRPDRASGFCYFNDPVLAILRLLDRGLSRICYVDLDAHHGDGVQDAFHDDDRVLTISIHEGARWPFTGKVGDRAGGAARNLPVPAGFNDSELDFLMERAVLPLVTGFGAEAMVVQAGADALADDPLSRLELSNRALWRAVADLAEVAPRTLVLGGGGYNPWSVGRCWAGIWATLCGHDPTVPPTPAAEMVLRGLTWNRREGRNPPEHWFTTIADPPRDGPVREEIRRIAAEVLAS
ncbi:MAG: hypothetical protein RLY86_1835 [Pseudomonadota bacterium]|jgi:acetoin utilization protein AcuC